MEKFSDDHLNKVSASVEKVKLLVSKGMPGYYISSPFKPVQSFNLKFQEGIYFIKMVKADLPNMKLSDGEKEELRAAIIETEEGLIQGEIDRITTEAMIQLKSGIEEIIKNRK